MNLVIANKCLMLMRAVRAVDSDRSVDNLAVDDQTLTARAVRAIRAVGVLAVYRGQVSLMQAPSGGVVQRCG